MADDEELDEEEDGSLVPVEGRDEEEGAGLSKTDSHPGGGVTSVRKGSEALEDSEAGEGVKESEGEEELEEEGEGEMGVDDRLRRDLSISVVPGAKAAGKRSRRTAWSFLASPGPLLSASCRLQTALHSQSHSKSD